MKNIERECVVFVLRGSDLGSASFKNSTRGTVFSAAFARLDGIAFESRGSGHSCRRCRNSAKQHYRQCIHAVVCTKDLTASLVVFGDFRVVFPRAIPSEDIYVRPLIPTLYDFVRSFPLFILPPRIW
ncbi:hypothetical protein KM043_010528 [Ampulex compressa]|nr:hypothetical protein KM043_010528 [Ampulex compressa]